jgi:hypothetical protein
MLDALRIFNDRIPAVYEDLAEKYLDRPVPGGE